MLRGTNTDRRRQALWATGVALAVGAASPGAAVAQSGSFFAVLNNANNNADSRRSITYFDANDLDAGPMFSVFLGFERTGNDYVDPSAIDVDPATGDVYVYEFDNTLSGGAVGNGQTPPYPVDTAGDADLFKIPFALVYNDWATKYKGHNVRGENLVTGGTVPTGSKNSLNLDYVTYGPTDPNGTPFELSHSNTVELAGSVVKIGEVKRNWNPDSQNFFPYSFDFINSDTLLVVDDSSATTATNTAETDHEYRVIKRLASDTADHALDHLDGGFVNGASQFWQSTRSGKVALDVDGHSEPESSAFYQAAGGGIAGVWVTESDVIRSQDMGVTPGTAGDDVAFLQLDPNNGYAPLGYRQFLNGAPSFALDNNPFVSTATNDGKADKIFVDSDSGDVIIVESGFEDGQDLIESDGMDPPTFADREPSVLRGHVNYDNGGLIEITSWDEKVYLNPTKSVGMEQLIRGQWSAWDSVNDRVIFAMPGTAGTDLDGNNVIDPDEPMEPLATRFQMDLFVIDMKVGSPTFGQTFSYLDLDDSVNLFTGDGFGDKVAAWTLLTSAEDADFDGVNGVDGADVLEWQQGLGILTGASNAQGDANGDGDVDAGDLAIWVNQFGTAAVSAATAAPEPSGAMLLALAATSLGVRRRRS